MRFAALTSQALLAATSLLSCVSATPAQPRAGNVQERALEYVIKPKMFIISMFAPEAAVWWGIQEFNLLARNITVSGFSPLFPDAHCTVDGEVCQLVTGESEINAAVTISSLLQSRRFDLTTTYFMIAGIAGISPEVATLGSVTFARYAVQVALQYEFDPREIPANFSTGYVPQGATQPDQYPADIYGTEVFEVNQALQHLATGFARSATLNDSSAAITYRANYASASAYAAGAAAPSVVECDVATSDVYYSGTILSTAFANYTSLVTNGSGVYCTTAQEDNATLEALLRGAVTGLVDFARIIVMRTASDFDRPYPGEAATTNLFWADQGGFGPAIQNIYRAGVKVVDGILGEWNSTFAHGVNATNYVGDIFGTLGGTPDFGPGSRFGDNPVLAKREAMAGMKGRKMRKRGVVVRVGRDL
ncbi:putative purine nucleoside permease [Cryomyces antarcticus]